MSSRTAWTAGNGAGLAWTALFGSEVSALTNGKSVLSSVDIANGGSVLDQFMDVSLEATIASSTIAAGANFWALADGADAGRLDLWRQLPDHDPCSGDAGAIPGRDDAATRQGVDHGALWLRAGHHPTARLVRDGVAK